jgi:hypothetical protein
MFGPCAVIRLGARITDYFGVGSLLIGRALKIRFGSTMFGCGH